MPAKVIESLSAIVVLSNVAYIAVVVTYILSRKSPSAKPLWNKIENILIRHSLQLAFVVSLVATTGSLFLSEVAHYTPCILCWYQRILMYPQVILFGLALARKQRDVIPYTFALSILGSFLAGYHYILQNNPNPFAPCASIGYSVSCTEKYFTYFGYVTIPWMSFSAFLIIVSLMWLAGKNRVQQLKS